MTSILSDLKELIIFSILADNNSFSLSFLNESLRMLTCLLVKSTVTFVGILLLLGNTLEPTQALCLSLYFPGTEFMLPSDNFTLKETSSIRSGLFLVKLARNVNEASFPEHRSNSHWYWWHLENQI